MATALPEERGTRPILGLSGDVDVVDRARGPVDAAERRVIPEAARASLGGGR